MEQTRITTLDNPYNPFTQFNEWFLFDIEKGHNTCDKLARLVSVLSNDSESEDEVVNKAMDRMIDLFFIDDYIKVTSDMVS